MNNGRKKALGLLVDVARLRGQQLIHDSLAPDSSDAADDLVEEYATWSTIGKDAQDRLAALDRDESEPGLALPVDFQPSPPTPLSMPEMDADGVFILPTSTC